MALSEPWWSEYILTEGVAVYHIDLAANPAREAEAVATLNKEEVERWRRYRSGGPRRRYVLCRAALRTILCQALGCENSALDFYLMAYGKPIALTNGVPAEINFSVSHSGDHGLIAISRDALVGVDVEDRATRLPLDSLMEASLSLEERKELSQLDGDARDRVFLDRWTIKEAIIKALGLGLRMNMRDFEVPAEMRGGAESHIFETPQAPGIRWRLQTLGRPEFAAALALELRGEADKEIVERSLRGL